MSFFESIKESISSSFDKRKEERDAIERLRKEAEINQKLIFEEQFRKNAFEVVKAKAMEDAAKLSGLQKLRAQNRLSRLNDREKRETQRSFFDRLSEYTQKNVSKREENLERTKKLREEAKKMREERMEKNKRGREERMKKNKRGREERMKKNKRGREERMNRNKLRQPLRRKGFN